MRTKSSFGGHNLASASDAAARLGEFSSGGGLHAVTGHGVGGRRNVGMGQVDEQDDVKPVSQ